MRSIVGIDGQLIGLIFMVIYHRDRLWSMIGSQVVLDWLLCTNGYRRGVLLIGRAISDRHYVKQGLVRAITID